jgi:uncharacterized protein YcbX
MKASYINDIQLYIYPIKSLAPLSLPRARLRRDGLEHDRRFMLLKVLPDGRYKNIQITFFPECALFHQQLDFSQDTDKTTGNGDGGEIVVTYHVPSPPIFVPEAPEQRTALRIPLNPDLGGRDVIDVSIGGSPTAAYRMGGEYDRWFTACFGYEVALVYIGDQGRDVLAHKPSEHHLWRRPQQQRGGWLGSITSHIPGVGNGGADGKQEEQLAFNDCAPFLVTSKASLRDVSKRLPEGEEMDMRRFRPNIVVDERASPDAAETKEGLRAWDEDFWAEVSVVRRGTGDAHRLALTANCGRCISINVDYETGRPSEGEPGSVLKKLMADRRVDKGNKYTPIFGRYAFLAPGQEGTEDGGNGVEITVGDEIHVTRRLDYRDEWAWPKQ